MSQFLTLIWLKFTLFRNSLRSKKNVASTIATVAGTIIALLFAMLVALGLGVASYSVAAGPLRRGAAADGVPVDGFSFLFVIFAGIFLMWATVPLSLGGASQFDAGRMLLYPISLRKLFVADFASEVTSLGSIFAIPVVIAVSIGAGIGRGTVSASIVGCVFVLFFGISLAKWLSISVGALTRKKRSRGETLLALIGAVLGLGGAFIGQLAPALIENPNLWRVLRWSPPGAAVMAVMGSSATKVGEGYFTGLVLLLIYSSVLVVVAFWIARRSALGMGSGRKPAARLETSNGPSTGWSFALLSEQTSALLEKEIRYALRNAQLRMLGILPLVLIGIKFAQTEGTSKRAIRPGGFSQLLGGLGPYTEGFMAAVAVLYIFMVLGGLACNAFAYDGSGMKTLILSPIRRKNILFAKNLTVMLIGAVFSVLFLVVNEAVFRDLSLEALAFVIPSFVISGLLLVMVGNLLSIYFPKRMVFGKRINTAGIASLSLLPIFLGMGILLAMPVLAGFSPAVSPLNMVHSCYWCLSQLPLMPCFCRYRDAFWQSGNVKYWNPYQGRMISEGAALGLEKLELNSCPR